MEGARPGGARRNKKCGHPSLRLEYRRRRREAGRQPVAPRHERRPDRCAAPPPAGAGATVSGAATDAPWRLLERAERLHDATAVERALERMADGLNAALADSAPLVLCLMHGGLVPAGLLLPRLRFPLQLDYLHLGRYRGGVRGGRLQWMRRPDAAVRGRTVLLLDDILDKGNTLEAAVRECRKQGAARVLSAVLVKKRCRSRLEADFYGLEVPDRYVVGYGMDYRGYLRNCPGIYMLPPETR